MPKFKNAQVQKCLGSLEREKCLTWIFRKTNCFLIIYMYTQDFDIEEIQTLTLYNMCEQASFYKQDDIHLYICKTKKQKQNVTRKT